MNLNLVNTEFHRQSHCLEPVFNVESGVYYAQIVFYRLITQVKGVGNFFIAVSPHDMNKNLPVSMGEMIVPVWNYIAFMFPVTLSSAVVEDRRGYNPCSRRSTEY